MVEFDGAIVTSWHSLVVFGERSCVTFRLAPVVLGGTAVVSFRFMVVVAKVVVWLPLMVVVLLTLGGSNAVVEKFKEPLFRGVAVSEIFAA